MTESSNQVRNPGDRSIFVVGNYGEWGEHDKGEQPSFYPNNAKAPGYLVYRLYPYDVGVYQLKHAVAWFIDEGDARAYAAWRNVQPPDGPFSVRGSDETAAVRNMCRCVGGQLRAVEGVEPVVYEKLMTIGVPNDFEVRLGSWWEVKPAPTGASIGPCMQCGRDGSEHAITRSPHGPLLVVCPSVKAGARE